MSHSEEDLRPLAFQAIEHWKEFLPAMYRRLNKAGMLHKEAMLAAEKTLDEMAELMSQGFPSEAAWEIVRETYLFRPEEPGTTPEPEESEGYRLAAQTQLALNEAARLSNKD
jgi:hypothetical protein